jgi:hypothetical protein
MDRREPYDRFILVDSPFESWHLRLRIQSDPGDFQIRQPGRTTKVPAREREDAVAESDNEMSVQSPTFAPVTQAGRSREGPRSSFRRGRI